MKTLGISQIDLFVLRFAIWFKIALPAICSLCLELWDYDLIDIKDQHPIQHALFSHALTTLPWIGAAAALIFLYVIYIENKHKPKILNFQKQLDEYQSKNEVLSTNVSELFNGYLLRVATSLGFGSKENNCERITLYIHNKKSGFTKCGRYSANPDYNTVNRSFYPDTQGCIAKGWQNGWHFENKLPCPKNEKQNYISMCLKEYDLPRNTTRKIKMKSRLYAVSCVKKNEAPYAVIVVESTEEDRFTEDQIRKILEEQSDYLGHIISVLRDYIPELDVARSAKL